MRWSVVIGIAFVDLLRLHAVAEPVNDLKAVSIPREQILIGNSGSRELRDLERELFFYRDTPEKIAKYSTEEGKEERKRLRKQLHEKSLVLAIEKAVRSKQKVGPGFAVEGQGRAALKGIHEVLVKGGRPQQRFRAGNDLSVVFYSLLMQPAVRLESVTRKGQMIDIQYVLISHGRTSINWTLAIIPVGKLQPGEYRVRIQRLQEKEAERNQRDFPSVGAGTEKRYVCQPFNFTVTDNETAAGGEQ